MEMQANQTASCLSTTATFRPSAPFIGSLVTLFSAVAIALMLAMPSFMPTFFVVAACLGLPAVLTTGVVYAKGPIRAFFIGALFPSVAPFIALTQLQASAFFGDLVSLTPDARQWALLPSTLYAYAAVSWLLSLMVGSACTACCFWLRRWNP